MASFFADVHGECDIRSRDLNRGTLIAPDTASPNSGARAWNGISSPVGAPLDMKTQASHPAFIIQQSPRAVRVTCRLAVAVGLALAIGLLTSTTWLQAQVALDAEAASGVPFGVGRVTLRSGGEFRINRLARPGGQRGGRIADLAKRIADQVATNNNNPPTNLKMAEMAVSERSGRVVYPVFEKRDRPVLREFIAVPTQTAIYFLFQGDAPLELTVYTPEPQVVRVVPRVDANGYDRLLRSWWADFSAAAD
ncbi:MAG TPA: hypothetical protein VHV08_02325, partial [Pirellulales bacterium]|nr:hypothetical protein [Pirellulales bacterium]